LPIIYDEDKDKISLFGKIRKLKSTLDLQPFFLLVRPNKTIYKHESARKIFEEKIDEIIKLGIKNLEVPWEDSDDWLNLMSNLKSKYPFLQIGSASLINKKSIDDSIKLGLDFSMMRFWDKELFLYSKENNYLLIPGLNQLKEFNDANFCKCQIVKIFPVKLKNKDIEIRKYADITFIGAGDLSINNLKEFKKIGYKGIVIGKKGFNDNQVNPEIISWLKKNNSFKNI